MQSPVWGGSQIASLCSAVPNAQGSCSAVGLISILLVSCDGAPQPGVTVAITPAPAAPAGEVVYNSCTAENCSLFFSGTATTTTGNAVGFDFPAGEYTITASAAPAQQLSFDPFVLHRGAPPEDDVVIL